MASKAVRADLDFEGENQLIRPIAHKRANPPSQEEQAEAEFFYAHGRLGFVGQTKDGTNRLKPIDPSYRPDHHGKQKAETIEDFHEAVTGTRLDEFAEPTQPVKFNGQPAVNLGAPVSENDAARMAELSQVLSYTNDLYKPVEATLRAIGGAALVHVPVLAATDQPFDFGAPFPVVIDGETHDGSPDVPILIFAQSAIETNGIHYPNPSGGWRRATTFTNGAGEIVDLAEFVASGAIVHVTKGQKFGNQFFSYSNGRYLDPDTDAQAGVWTRFLNERDSINTLAEPTQPVAFGGQRLTDLAPSQQAGDAVRRSELDAARAAFTSGQQSADARTLDQIPAPAADVSLAQHEITNLKDGSTPQSASTVKQLSDARAALQQAISDAQAQLQQLQQTSDARTLDQIPRAAATVDLNAQRLSNVSPSQADNDAVVRSELQSARAELAARTLDQIPTAANVVNLGGQRITAAGDPLDDSDLITRRYVRGLVSGIDWKRNARVVALTDVPLSGLGTVSGKQLADGDRVLTPKQTDAKKRIIWVARAGAWEKSDDTSGASLTAGATVIVTEGEGKGEWRLLTPDPLVEGQTDLEWDIFPIHDYTASKGARLVGTDIQVDETVARKFTAVLGAGSQWTINHNLASEAVVTQLWDVSVTPWEAVDARIEQEPSGNTAYVSVSNPVGAGVYRFNAVG